LEKPVDLANPAAGDDAKPNSAKCAPYRTN
jgi:hypothetical protein